MSAQQIRYRYQLSLIIFISGLVLSGLTAFPLQLELRIAAGLLGIQDTSSFAEFSGLKYWIAYVCHGINSTYSQYPFFGYGTDWLAFGHLVIAMFFIKPLYAPMGQEWVLKCGIIACLGVIPLAFICGEIRHIPMYWRMVDCAFGVFGLVPLLYCLRQVKRLTDLHNLQ